MSTQPIKVSSRQSLHNLQYSAPALLRQHWQHWIISRMSSKQHCTMLRITDFCHSSNTTLQNVANNRIMSLIKNNSAEQQIFVTHQKQLCRMFEQQISVTHAKQLFRMLRTTYFCHSSKTTLQNVANKRIMSLIQNISAEHQISVLIKNSSAECCEHQISVTHQTQLCSLLRTTDFCHWSKTTLQIVANNSFLSLIKITLQNVANNIFL